MVSSSRVMVVFLGVIGVAILVGAVKEAGGVAGVKREVGGSVASFLASVEREAGRQWGSLTRRGVEWREACAEWYASR